MTTTILSAPAHIAPESISVKPTRDQVIEAICRETSVTPAGATSFLSWITNVVVHSRTHGYGTYYLSDREIEKHHDVLVTIAPDDTAAKPGSAHDLVERFVLDPSRDEHSLLHSMEEDGITYCTVRVGVGVFR